MKQEAFIIKFKENKGDDICYGDYSDDKDIRILDNEPLIENKKLNILMTKTKTREEEDDEL